MTATASGARNRRRANLDPRQQHRMADTANSVAWQDPSVRPAFSNGVGRALVPGRAASGTGPRQHRGSPMRAHASSAVHLAIVVRASLIPTRDSPSSSSRNRRDRSPAHLEHWRDVNERGVNDGPWFRRGAQGVQPKLQRRQNSQVPAADRRRLRGSERREGPPAAVRRRVPRGCRSRASSSRAGQGGGGDKAVKAAFGAQGRRGAGGHHRLLQACRSRTAPSRTSTSDEFDSEPSYVAGRDRRGHRAAPFAPPARVARQVRIATTPSRRGAARTRRHQHVRTGPVRAEVRRGRCASSRRR